MRGGSTELQVSQADLSPLEGGEANIPWSHFQPQEKQKGIANSKHGYTKGKSYLTSLIAFCTEVTGGANTWLRA